MVEEVENAPVNVVLLSVLAVDGRYMARESVRWNYKLEEFEVGGEPAMWGVDVAAFIGAEERVRSASLTDLKHAARRYWATMYDYDLTFRVYDVPEDLLREGEGDFSPHTC